jgi:WD40 repeat protein
MKVHVWDLETGRAARTLEGHTGTVHALAFVGRGRYLASGGRDGLRVWDPVDGRAAGAWNLSGSAGYGIALGLDGREMVATCGDNSLRVLENSEAPLEQVPEPPAGFLGVSYSDGDGGALINAVLAGTQAEKTGFRDGDVILEANETPVRESDDFLQFMRRSREGDEVFIRLRRDGAPRVVRVKLGRWER